MAGRKVVPIAINKKHFTEAEKNKRSRAEESLKGRNNRIKSPIWLGETAKKEFRRLAHELTLTGIICNTDIGGLAIACDAYEKYILATSAISASTINAQITKQTDATTTVKKSPLNAVEKYATIYRQYCAEYGLTPASRIKMSATVMKEENKDPDEERMSELASRRQARI